uniref:Thioredoxin domain-containing protein n=1 Tax=Chrysotila carterae TaxID=13221 RepID=A0A7S4ESR1_CHRCT
MSWHYRHGFRDEAGMMDWWDLEKFAQQFNSQNRVSHEKAWLCECCDRYFQSADQRYHCLDCGEDEFNLCSDCFDRASLRCARGPFAAHVRSHEFVLTGSTRNTDSFFSIPKRCPPPVQVSLPLKKGTLVTLHSLVRAAHLNGAFGLIDSNDGNRYEVQLQQSDGSSAKIVSVKPDNVSVPPPLEKGTRVCVHSLSRAKDYYNGTYGVVVEVIDNGASYLVDMQDEPSNHRLLVKRHNLKLSDRSQGGAQLLTLAREDHFAGVVNRFSVTVAGFFTNWCEPCQRLRPVFERLAKDSHDIPQSMAFAFLVVNPDNFPGLVWSCGLTGYPTVFFYVDGRPLHHLRITQCDPNGLRNVVTMLKSKYRMQAPSPSAPLSCAVPTSHGYCAFLSHDWGHQNKNHERVQLVNSLLREEGITTWFDEQDPDQGGMEGDIIQAMDEAIEKSCVFVLFITQNYMEKLSSKKANNCKREFRFANRKWKDDCTAIIKVVMEPHLLDENKWCRDLFCDHSGHLYVDMSSESKLKSNLGRLAQQIQSRKSKVS